LTHFNGSAAILAEAGLDDYNPRPWGWPLVSVPDNWNTNQSIHKRSTQMTKLATLSLAGLLFAGVANGQERAADTAEKAEKAKPPLNVKMKTLEGKDVNLGEKYNGKVVLLVNVASECGLTPQYEQLQALHAKYNKEGLAIVGVPCNQFNTQEPGTAEEIREFCTKNYGVEFDLLAKVDVNGEEACDLYKWLTSEETNKDFAGKITWNFEKFLISRDGDVVARIAPRTKPDDKEVIAKIEAELKKKESKEG
jgi:glutathione peroxidase